MRRTRENKKKRKKKVSASRSLGSSQGVALLIKEFSYKGWMQLLQDVGPITVIKEKKGVQVVSIPYPAFFERHENEGRGRDYCTQLMTYEKVLFGVPIKYRPLAETTASTMGIKSLARPTPSVFFIPLSSTRCSAAKSSKVKIHGK